MHKFRLPRTFSSLLILAGIGVAFILPVVKLAPLAQEEVTKIYSSLPQFESDLKTRFLSVSAKVENKTKFKVDPKVFDTAVEKVKSQVSALFLGLPKLLASLLEWVFLVPLVLFFLLRDGRSFRYKWLSITPNSFFEKAYFLIYHFDKKLGDYIFAKFIEASIVGLIITVGLLVLDVRFALVLGLIAAVTNVIPYLGPLLGVIPPVLMALGGVFDESTAWSILVLYSIANILDLAFVFPILVSKVVNLHPLVVVTSVIIGSHFFGMAGMVISVPCAAIIKLVGEEIKRGLYSSRPDELP